MKKITEKIEITEWKEVHSGKFKTITKFQSEDGEIWDREMDARYRDSCLKIEKVERKCADIFVDFELDSNGWHRAKDEEELTFLLEYLGYNEKDRIKHGSDVPKVGEWFNRTSEDMGDNYPYYRVHFITYSTLKNSINAFIKAMEE